MAKPKRRTYRCGRGHEIITDGGTWTTFVFQQNIDGVTQSYEFNYCPRCFGAWAEAKFPMVEVKTGGET